MNLDGIRYFGLFCMFILEDKVVLFKINIDFLLLYRIIFDFRLNRIFCFVL